MLLKLLAQRQQINPCPLIISKKKCLIRHFEKCRKRKRQYAYVNFVLTLSPSQTKTMGHTIFWAEMDIACWLSLNVSMQVLKDMSELLICPASFNLSPAALVRSWRSLPAKSTRESWETVTWFLSSKISSPVGSRGAWERNRETAEWENVSSRVHATLQPTLSVCRSVRR